MNNRIWQPKTPEVTEQSAPFQDSEGIVPGGDGEKSSAYRIATCCYDDRRNMMKRHFTILLVLMALAVSTSGCIGKIGPDLDKLGAEVTLNQFFAAVEEQEVEAIEGLLAEEVHVVENGEPENLSKDEVASSFMFMVEGYTIESVNAIFDSRTYGKGDPCYVIGDLLINVTYESQSDEVLLGCRATITLAKRHDGWKITGFSFAEWDVEEWPRWLAL